MINIGAFADNNQTLNKADHYYYNNRFDTGQYRLGKFL